MNPNYSSSRVVINKFIFFISLFTLVTFIGAQYYFKGKEQKKYSLPKEKFIFNFNQVNEIIEFTLTNKFGKNTFIKDNDPIYPWKIKSKKKIIAQTKKIKKILSELKSLQIKKIIPLDKINYKNYSLDLPSYHLDLFIEGLNKVQLKIGLINHLKRTAFIQLNQDNYLYEVGFRKLNQLEARLQDFIDRSPLSIPHLEIIKIEIIKVANNKKQSKKMNIEKRNNEWFNSQGKMLDSNKVNLFIKNLAKIKSIAILDSLNSDEESLLNQSKKRTHYKIKMTFKNDHFLESSISKSTRLNISGVTQLHKKFVLWTKKRPFPLLLSEDFQDVMKTKEKSLKRKIKEIIY